MAKEKELPEQSPIPRTSKLAVAALVLGLLSFTGFMFWPLQVLPGVVCGLIALYKISHSKGRYSGENCAIAGILVSVIILGLIPMLVHGNIPIWGQRFDKVRIVTTRATLLALYDAVNEFKVDAGRYPTNEEGLQVLIEKPANVNHWDPNGYLEWDEIPKDAWRHDFVYKLNLGEEEAFVIISYGADGEEGGEGYDADLRGTDLE